MKEVVELLKEKCETISVMESCTGGYIAHEITNIDGSSNVFAFGAVTYSNEYKIKMGVPKGVIEKYTVYSIEVAREMAKAISNFTNSTYGVGITGKLNTQDPNNKEGNLNTIYICIYDKKSNKYQTIELEGSETRIKSKQKICNVLNQILKEIIKG